MERRRKKTDVDRPAEGRAPRTARLSFWQKIYLCTLALFLFCLNAGVFAVAAVGQSSSFEAERERLLTRQHFIAETLAQDMAAVEARRPGALPALAQDYALSYGGSGAWLKVTRGGSTLADRLPAPDDAAALPEAEQEGTRVWEVLPAGGRRVLYVSALLPGQGERTALTCAFDMEQFFAAWGRTARAFQGIALAASAMLAVGLHFALRGLGRPLARLAEAAQAIGDGDYTIRAREDGQDEIGQLARAFNEMARRTGETVEGLAEAAREKQRFADNLAHELRTPLTAIGGYAEYIARAELCGEERAQAAQIIQEETRRLSSMSERLLTMASLREGKLHAESVDLAQAAHAALRAVRPQAASRRVQITAERVEPFWIKGDRDLLVSLAVNLMDNAVKASGEGGQVTLSLLRDSGGALLTVEDRGTGMDSQTLSRLGEPFYRADNSRSRAQGGTGLGVAFCFAVTQAHGASLSFDSQPGHGTRAVVRFPACGNGQTGEGTHAGPRKEKEKTDGGG
ncbi:HAMP domain-containing histidine kinase [Anaerofilum sp. BX8]|uniref:histidine kinase n=1 Tax=Anaerofilum hominis TaxID=2763016 RepID=A0A923KVG6_9FIRM|nr:HAMP domain-containing sensor histidine kinase [Anaerofilum hominis]MBC5580776.1 HAMP domain-containing histidine kinase [Anaerofilum hominis]